MTTTYQNATIAGLIRDGSIQVGDTVQTDRDVTCDWEVGRTITAIVNDLGDGFYRILSTDERNGESECLCGTAQRAACDITVTRPERTATAAPTISQLIHPNQTYMQNVIRMIKSKCTKTDRLLAGAGYLDGEGQRTEKYSSELWEEVKRKLIGAEDTEQFRQELAAALEERK